MVSILMIPGLPCSTAPGGKGGCGGGLTWIDDDDFLDFFPMLGGFQHLEDLECASSSKNLPYFGD